MATEAAITADPFRQAAFTFLAAMTALAIIEHWFLVLPIPAEAMWNWSMKSREHAGRPAHDHRRAGSHRHDHSQSPSPPPLASQRPGHGFPA